MGAYSVLMSVYYREKAEYLRLSMESMVTQTVPPEQFVLVCDGPLTPELDAVIAEYEAAYPDLMTVVRLEKNMGIGAALNAGLQFCRNEIVARMDSDDIAVKERMEIQLKELDTYKNVSVVGGQTAEFYDDPDMITGYREVPVEEIPKYMKIRNPMNHMTVVFHKSHIAEVGNYQEFPGPGFEDYYLWVSLVANGKQLRNVSEVCCKVRANADMYSRRGGINYFRNCMKVENLLLRSGIISRFRYGVNIVMWFTGTVLLPPKFRKAVFLNVLRKRELEAEEMVIHCEEETV